MTRHAFCLFLLCASAMASARDVRMHGPNGDGGACSEPTAAPAAVMPPAHATSTAISHAKVKAPPLFRGSDDDASPHMPRWHSFLPGMFR